MYIYIYIYMQICVYTHTYIYMYVTFELLLLVCFFVCYELMCYYLFVVDAGLSASVCIFVGMRAQESARACPYTHSLCVYIYIYIYMYTHIYIYIYI